MATIGTLAARILADASGVRSGMGMTRNELKITRGAFLATRDDSQKLQMALDQLASAKDKGAFRDAQDYAKAVAAVKAELDPATVAQRQLDEAIAATQAKLQDQIATFGISADEIDRYRLEQQGATQEQLESVAALQQQRAALEADAAAKAAAAQQAQQLESSITQTRNALYGEIDAFGMSADEIKLRNLALEGADDATLENVRALQQQRNALQADADATARAKQIKEQVRTPTERYSQEIRELNQLLKSGKLSQDVHARAVQQAGQRYGVAGKQAGDLAGRAKQVGLSHAGAIPGVGGLTNVLSAGHPALIAAAAAIAGVTIAVKAGKAAIDAYVSGVGRAIDEIDKLAKTSAKLGMATDSLLSLRYAGEQTGVAANTFDMAIQRMTRRVAEAAKGTGEAKDAIKELGLDAKRLAAGTPDQAFRKIAGAMGEVEHQGHRVRLAMRLFDSEGVALVNTLALGEQGLADMEARAKELGLTLNSVDAAAVEQMRDTWNDVGQVLQGIAMQAAVDLAPTLQVAAQQIIEILKPGSQIGDTIRFSLAAVPPLLGKCIDLAQVLIGLFQGWQHKAQAAVGVFIEAAAAADRVTAALVPGREVDDGLQAFADDFRRRTELLGKEAGERISKGMNGAAQAEIEKLRRSAASGLQAPDSSLPDTGATAAASEQSKLFDALTKTTDALAEQIVTADMSADEIQRWRLAIAGATEQTLESVAAMQRQAEAAKKAAELQANIKKTTDALREQAATAGMSAEQIERWRLAIAGATEQTLESVAAMQREAQAAKDLVTLRQDLIGLQDRKRSAAIDRAELEMAERLQRVVINTGRQYPEGVSAAAKQYGDELRRQLELQQLIRDLRREGHSEQYIRHAASIMQQNHALDRQAESFERRRKLFAEGASLVEKHRRPEEEYADTLRRLREMLDAGAIDMRTFVREKREAASELMKPLELKFGTSGIQATAKGSAEALARIDELRARGKALQEIKLIDKAAAEEKPLPPPPTPTMPQPPTLSTPLPVSAIGATYAPLPESPAVPDMAATIAPNWSALPDTPEIGDLGAGIEALWGPLPESPAVPDMAASIGTTYSPLPAAPELPDQISAIQSSYVPPPESPAVENMAASIDTRWKEVATPQPVQDMAASIEPVWGDVSAPPELPELSTTIALTYAKELPSPPEPVAPPVSSLQSPVSPAAPAAPADSEPPSDPAWPDALKKLDRIAAATEAWLEKEGVVIEEIRP